EATANPELHYNAADGISKIPCSLDQAQFWLRQGYFTSTTRFILRAADGKEGECTTLAELIARNGRAMPFSEWCDDEEKRKEQMEELARMNEEMVALKQRRERLLQVISLVNARRTNISTELDRIAQKFLTSPQTDDASPVSLVPSSATSGVDPFALLARGAVSRKMEGDLITRFSELRARFDRCDKKKLTLNTSGLFPKNGELRCTPCDVKIPHASVMVMHISCKRHVEAMKGTACADAFDFWSNAVDTVMVDTVAGGDTVVADVAGLRCEGGGKAKAIPSKKIDILPASTVPSPNPTDKAAKGDSSQQAKPKAIAIVHPLPSASSPQISPSTGVDPFALLRSCEGSRWKVQGHPKTRLLQLLNAFQRCDKGRLLMHTSALFADNKVTKCELCHVRIESSSEFLTHVCSNKHISAMKGIVCADAFDFWWGAVESVSDGGGSWRPKMTEILDSSEWAMPVVDQPPVPAHMLKKLAKAPVTAPPAKANLAYRGKKKGPIDLTGLAILMKTTEGKNYKVPERYHLYKLSTLVRKCDLQKLDKDPIVMKLFQKQATCMICNEGSFSCGSQLLEHLLSDEHWAAIIREQCTLPPSSLAFWKGAAYRSAKNAPA
ncbi:hypothetical protein PMAYCL1PPCAC_14210, partial [Pristionchus mayeri]